MAKAKPPVVDPAEEADQVDEGAVEEVVVDPMADWPEIPGYPAKYIGVDLHQTGGYTRVQPPAGWFRDRAIPWLMDGNVADGQGGYTATKILVNLEHVADDENGAWLYRRM